MSIFEEYGPFKKKIWILFGWKKVPHLLLWFTSELDGCSAIFHTFLAGLWNARLVQLVPFPWEQVRNFTLLVLGQGLHYSSKGVYPDYEIYIIFFLFFERNICCGYSLEVPHRGTFNEYPQHLFSMRNKKNVNFLDKWVLIIYLSVDR